MSTISIYRPEFLTFSHVGFPKNRKFQRITASLKMWVAYLPTVSLLFNYMYEFMYIRFWGFQYYSQGNGFEVFFLYKEEGRALGGASKAVDSVDSPIGIVHAVRSPVRPAAAVGSGISSREKSSIRTVRGARGRARWRVLGRWLITKRKKKKEQKNFNRKYSCAVFSLFGRLVLFSWMMFYFWCFFIVW